MAVSDLVPLACATVFLGVFFVRAFFKRSLLYGCLFVCLPYNLLVKWRETFTCVALNVQVLHFRLYSVFLFVSLAYDSIRL